jgi:hypothetical protein
MAQIPWMQGLVRTAAQWGRRRSPFVLAAVVIVAAVVALLLSLMGRDVDKGSRIKMASLVFGFPAGSDQLSASVSIRNEGSLPASIIGSNNAFVLAPKPMTGREEDDEWQHLGDAEEIRQQIHRTLQPGEDWRDYAVVRAARRAEYQGFLGGAYLLYFLMRTEYRDPSLPITKHRVTEICYYFVKDLQRPRSCHSHNRLLVSD